METSTKKNTRYTYANFIEKATKKHGAKCDYSLIREHDIINGRSVITIKCKECKAVTQQTVLNHIKSLYGCRACIPAKSFKWTLQMFLDKAKEVHGDKYDYSMVENSHITGVRSKIPVRCKKCNLLWDATLSHHIHEKTQCPECCFTNRWTGDKFLERAAEIHDGKYTYDMQTVRAITTAKSQVTITCENCNESRSITVSSHINKTAGCLHCKNRARWTLSRFLEKAYEIHGDVYDYSKIKESDIIGRHSKVPIVCNTCAYEWTPSINHHIYSESKCVQCSNRVRWDLERFVNRALCMHGDAYDYSRIKKDDITGSESKIPIMCNTCNYTWSPTVSSFINGWRGCPNCADKIKWTLDRLLERTKQVHGDKYDYSQIKETDITGNTSKIAVSCNVCKYSWITSIASHITCAAGCPNCVGLAQWTLDRFIKQARKIHGNKYRYFCRPCDIVNVRSRVFVTCEKCDYQWFSAINDHINKQHNCPRCMYSLKWNLERFLEKSKQIHGEKYSYDQITESHISGRRSHIPVKCNTCECTWFPAIRDHIRGHGCPHCATVCGYSKKEIEWIESIMETEGIIVQYAKSPQGQHKIKFPNGQLRSVDGYCHATNTVYEYNGDFWHGNPCVFNQTDVNRVNKKTFGDLYKDTVAKENIIKQLGYNLVVKWETPLYNTTAPKHQGRICKMFMKALADLSSYAIKHGVDDVVYAFKENLLADREKILADKAVQEDFSQIEQILPENACQALNTYKQNEYQIVTQCDEEIYNCLLDINDNLTLCDSLSIYTKQIIKRYCILVSYIVFNTD